jgi:hypothetical protein
MTNHKQAVAKRWSRSCVVDLQRELGNGNKDIDYLMAKFPGFKRKQLNDKISELKKQKKVELPLGPDDLKAGKNPFQTPSMST